MNILGGSKRHVATLADSSVRDITRAKILHQLRGIGALQLDLALGSNITHGHAVDLALVLPLRVSKVGGKIHVVVNRNDCTQSATVASK